ncbi:MAG: hypothetical protein DWG80_07640 [Chloroflexi bacterium]|nr:hypothetical protein [Chloroflexota bacterium]
MRDRPTRALAHGRSLQRRGERRRPGPRPGRDGGRAPRPRGQRALGDAGGPDAPPPGGGPSTSARTDRPRAGPARRCRGR